MILKTLMDITTMKAKRDLVLYEKITEAWGKNSIYRVAIFIKETCSTVLFGNLGV
jgi:hypothetical protein